MPGDLNISNIAAIILYLGGVPTFSLKFVRLRPREEVTRASCPIRRKCLELWIWQYNSRIRIGGYSHSTNYRSEHCIKYCNKISGRKQSQVWNFSNISGTHSVPVFMVLLVNWWNQDLAWFYHLHPEDVDEVNPWTAGQTSYLDSAAYQRIFHWILSSRKIRVKSNRRVLSTCGGRLACADRR